MVGAIAEGRQLPLAVVAFAACNLERSDNTLANLQVGDIGTNLIDDAHELYSRAQIYLRFRMIVHHNGRTS